MNPLLLRSITGAVYVAVITLTLAFGHIWGFTGLCMLMGLLSWKEVRNLILPSRGNSSVAAILDLLIVLSLISAVALSANLLTVLIVILSEILFLIICRAIVQLYIIESSPIRDLACSAFSVLYIGLPLCLATSLFHFCGWRIVMLLFIMIWLNDTGAFIVGSLIGRKRLFERLSPKKSWEGFIGGLIFSALAGFGAAHFFPQYFCHTTVYYIGIGLIVSVFATYGDLFESMLKRNAKVKDSGTILPGHGGILDRIDSLLFVIPAAAVYITIFAFI